MAQNSTPTATHCGDEIVTLYTALAEAPDQDFGWGKGKENARRLGYGEDWLNRLPDPVWASSAAVGNPFDLGPIGPGDVVLDLGCGSGADLFIAACLAGDTGRAIGIDITPAMVAKARGQAALLGLRTVDVHLADFTALPLADESVDVVISNGAINLSPSKACVFAEARRVLRPGGRLQFADMVQDPAVEEPVARGGTSWADCVAGTVAPEQYLETLETAGFRDAEHVCFTDYRTASTTIGACFRAKRP